MYGGLKEGPKKWEWKYIAGKDVKVTVTYTAGIRSRAGNTSLRDTEGCRSNNVTAYPLPLKKKMPKD